MKKITITFLFLFSAMIAFGQGESSEEKFNNEVKIMVTDLLNGSIMLGYERPFGDHIGVSLLAGYKGKDGLLKLSGLDTEFIKTGDLTYSGLRIIPEVRYYLEAHDGGMRKGFYFGAYLTFMSYNSSFEGDYMNDNGVFPFKYDMRINTNSVGLMVGYKLKLSDHFNLDFLIAGPGAGSYRLKMTEVIAAPDEFWFDLNDALELITLADLLEADFEFSPTKNSDDLILPSFRYGITLGYSF